MAAITVRDLRVELSDGRRLVDDVSLELEPGQVLGIVGESGSGKSTLAVALLAYARPGAKIAAGSVSVDGTDLMRLDAKQLRQARGRVVAYVPQDPASALNPALRISTQLGEVLDGDRAAKRARIREVLAAVDLPADDAFLARAAHELSGGQKQRVGLAMAAVARPRLLVLDEPTTGLDVSTQAKVLGMVARLCRDKTMAVIYISHDLAVIADVADEVAVMYAGQLFERGACADVVQTPAHPYTRALLASVPTTKARRRLQTIPGRSPSPQRPHESCRFTDRCGFASAGCSSATPRLEPVRTQSDQPRLVRCIRAREVGLCAEKTAEAPPHPVNEGTDSPSLLRVSALTGGYGDRQILFDISFDIAGGECLAVVGESGSGKTTLSQSLAGLQERWSGQVLLDGARLAAKAHARTVAQRREVQYIFQNPYSSLNPRATIGASIEAPLRHFFGLNRAQRTAKVAEVLDRVELHAELAARYPSELSGGQRQRAVLARALACEPRLLICDEVTSALDVSVQAAVVELLRGLLADGLSMVFVTHNLAVVRSLADRAIVLRQGHVVEAGAVEAVLDAPQHTYTRQLLADVLDLPNEVPA